METERNNETPTEREDAAELVPPTVAEEAARVETRFSSTIVKTGQHRTQLAVRLGVATSSIVDLTDSDGRQLFRSKPYRAREIWEDEKKLNKGETKLDSELGSFESLPSLTRQSSNQDGKETYH